MKKYIYLVIGFILFLGSVVNGLDLQPTTDSYMMGQNFGKLLIPIIGLILIFMFFRIPRKERKKE